jgi:hypothetical protein
LQLELLLEAYGKFEPIVYDTQGILDHGTDLVLRYRSETSAEEPDLLCFQVKSFDDLSKKTYMQELKAQRDDSFRKVIGLRHYFLVLCTDAEEHKDRVRNIMAEFRSADRTEVIEPAFVYTFLNHPKTRVDALVKRVMEAEDLVFRLALDSLELPSPSARALAVFLVVRFATIGAHDFTVEELLSEASLRLVYDELREHQAALLEMQGQSTAHPYDSSEIDDDDSDIGQGNDEDDEPVQIAGFEEQIAADLSLLENDMLELDSTSDGGELRPGQVQALNAVIADALARYDYDAEHLLSYMFSLMGIRD